jgi:SAM-dependent methyltransferase
VTAQDERVAAFETAGADYAELASRLRDPLRQILAGYAAPRRCDRVLDACCGTGASALPAARAVGPSGRVDAVDLAPSLLERGQAAATGLPQLRWLGPGLAGYRPVEGRPRPARDPHAYAELLCRIHPVGTVGDCAESMAATVETTGVRHLLRMAEGGGDPARTVENITRLGAEVLPVLRRRFGCPGQGQAATASGPSTNVGST